MPSNDPLKFWQNFDVFLFFIFFSKPFRTAWNRKRNRTEPFGNRNRFLVEPNGTAFLRTEPNPTEPKQSWRSPSGSDQEEPGAGSPRHGRVAEGRGLFFPEGPGDGMHCVEQRRLDSRRA